MKVIKRIWKNFLLFLASIFLVGAWFWEKQSLVHYQDEMQKARRQMSDFMSTLQIIESRESRLNILVYNFNTDTLKRDSLTLLMSYRDAILGYMQLWNAGQDISGVDADYSQGYKDLKMMSDSLNKLANAKKYKQVVKIYNDYSDYVYKSHQTAQFDFSKRMSKLEEGYKENDIIQKVFYGIGILLLFIRNLRKESSSEEDDNKTKETLKGIDSKMNKLIQSVEQLIKNRKTR